MVEIHQYKIENQIVVRGLINFVRNHTHQGKKVKLLNENLLNRVDSVHRPAANPVPISNTEDNRWCVL